MGLRHLSLRLIRQMLHVDCQRATTDTSMLIVNVAYKSLVSFVARSGTLALEDEFIPTFCSYSMVGTWP